MKDVEGFNLNDGISPEELEIYRKCVTHYFDTQFNRDVMSLSLEDRRRFYQMITDYPDLFVKLLHKGIPIVEYIYYGDEWYSAKIDDHDGINWDYDCPMVAEYKAMGFPVPVPQPHIPKPDLPLEP